MAEYKNATSIPSPDSSLSYDNMVRYGYDDKNMLPLGEETARLYYKDFNMAVFKLYEDNTEALAEDVSEIDGTTMYGVERLEWNNLYKERFENPTVSIIKTNNFNYFTPENSVCSLAEINASTEFLNSVAAPVENCSVKYAISCIYEGEPYVYEFTQPLAQGYDTFMEYIQHKNPYLGKYLNAHLKLENTVKGTEDDLEKAKLNSMRNKLNTYSDNVSIDDVMSYQKPKEYYYGQNIKVAVAGEMNKEEIDKYINQLKEENPEKVFTSLNFKADGEYVDVNYKYETIHFERIRRITGYLVGDLDRFNDAKRAEVADRVKHVLSSTGAEEELAFSTQSPSRPTTNTDYGYNVLADGTAEIVGYFGLKSAIEIPNKIDGYVVTKIREGAFWGSTNLKSITIPDSVTSIGKRAFDGCTGLKTITIPNGITSIGMEAFLNCTSLTNITIPDSVTSIGNGAFSDCTSLTGVTIPDSVTSIGDYAFWHCTNLANVVIGNGVEGIGSSAFSGCIALTSITIPDSVTSIGNGAFYNCTSLTNITIPDTVTSIGSCAFWNCPNLKNITIPDSVTSIGKCSFADCTSLKVITVPNSVTSIKECAFSDCGRLKSITIPDSVKNIGKDAFERCDNLTIKAPEGSYAQAYAKENNIKFNNIEPNISTQNVAQAATQASPQQAATPSEPILPNQIPNMGGMTQTM